MKQYSFFNLLFIICLGFVSCSKEDTSTVDQVVKQVLIKNVSEEIYYNGQVEKSSMDFNYENNILKSISVGDSKSEFIYDGEKIVKINGYRNSVLSGFTSFTYDGDLLKYTLSGDSQDEKTEFAYNSKGVLASQKSGYLNGTKFVVLETKNYSFDENENVVETLDNMNNGGMVVDSKRISAYDTKNNPTKFMNKYFKMICEWEGFDGLSKNNEISFDSFSPISATTPNTKIRFEIVYNKDDFPIEIRRISVESNSLIAKTNIVYQ